MMQDLSGTYRPGSDYIFFWNNSGSSNITYLVNNSLHHMSLNADDKLEILNVTPQGVASTLARCTRGQGQCNPGTTNPTLTLQQVLQGHTWSLSNCFSNFEQYSSPITLNANGTWSVPGSLYIGETWLPGEGPTTWTTSGNDYIILTYNARPDDVSPVELMEEIFPVSSFTATQITMPAAPESGCGTYIMTRQ